MIANAKKTSRKMTFVKYQHLERLGTTEVQNIEFGECYVFPKVDGTNACVWLHNGQVQAGSRNRHLTLDKDNAGFYAWVLEQDNIKAYLLENPTHRLYGEWLVPHSLKTYRENAWRNFYVFDVAIDKATEELRHACDSPVKHLHYNVYAPLLAAHNIRYIPPIATITNGTYEQFVNQLAKNVFLIEDGKGAGEGVVIKRYDFENKAGRQIWAKIVTSEFKEKHAIEMGGSKIQGQKLIEEEIAKKYVTTALVEKERAKIENESGWSSRMIPRLLNTVYYSVVREECWNFVKENKNPLLDFKRLQHFVFSEVKAKQPQLF
jgi:hypothetical protein